ncbi:hypothetical protein BP5796_08480 [Coleophoma crateriformis]|uniref:RRM domain-containing protein n=1 Tax=Coleophoma crateriformis TaxID=565419 RepID=A0A3D8R7Q5_9HELO|nr:hypothetical protein BP5796_08480 [Coleophoma crateriformis]
MAPGKSADDFNAIINQDRQRRKNEALAQEIFGKGRRSSAPGAGMINNRKPGTGPSLASRIGIQKRSVSTSTKPAPRLPRVNVRPAAGNVDAEWTHDLHGLNNPSGVPSGPRASRQTRNQRIQGALNGSASSPALNSQFNIISAPKPAQSLSIRGIAGPYVVMAKNFAPGTSAADIESAMTPVGGVALSCRLIAERPNVIAEIVFESKEGADNVVDTFNNQNADGHLLHVYHKIGALPSTTTFLTSQSAPVQPAGRSVTPLGPRAGDRGSDKYQSRERSRERGRDQVTDGSYGFDDRMDTDEGNQHDRGRGRGLYSDNMVNRNGRGRGGSRDRGRGYR